MVKFKTVRGMRDLLPDEARAMRYVEGVARDLAESYGYEEVITPVVESYELLSAKVGEEIRKRMYAFIDLGRRKVALRPEFTASIARLVVATLRNKPKPLRLFCIGSLYRYDEPQLGRYREFWQSNYELIGSKEPEADMEVLALTDELLRRLRIRGYQFKVGHVGILRGILEQEGIKEVEQNYVMQLLDKKDYVKALEFVKSLGVSERCVEALKGAFEARGDRPLDALKPFKALLKGYDAALLALDNLMDVLNLASESGLKLNVFVEAGFARGLEYYTGMIFEPFVPELNVALGGGGRYDRLIELFGGEPTPAVGVAHGIDRIVLAMRKQGILPMVKERLSVAVVPIDEGLKALAFKVASALREAGARVEVEILGRSVSRALQDADRRGLVYAVLIAPDELRSGEVVLRDMRKREQRTVKLEDLTKEVGLA